MFIELIWIVSLHFIKFKSMLKINNAREQSYLKVSVAFYAYQQEKLVRESLESLINQDYPDLQIVISDDASTDKTWEILQQTARQASSSVRIVLNRNESNLGMLANYSKAVSLCDGDLIFIADGDDISEPSRVSTCVNFWIDSGQVADLIATDLSDMTYEGEVLGVKHIDDLKSWNWEKWIKTRPYHAGASHMVTRRLLSLQPLSTKAMLADQCILFRSFLMGGALRLPQPLVRHRRGGVSNNGIVTKTYAAKHSNLLASSQQGIHETDQYLKDAYKLKAPLLLTKYLEKLRREFEFKSLCLQSTSFWGRVKLFLDYSDVSFRTRQRFIFFSSFGLIYSYLIKLKFFIKGLKD